MVWFVLSVRCRQFVHDPKAWRILRSCRQADLKFDVGTTLTDSLVGIL
jgi:hypothetical protein